MMGLCFIFLFLNSKIYRFFLLVYENKRGQAGRGLHRLSGVHDPLSEHVRVSVAEEEVPWVE